jgi:nitrate reductase assembly molybdenum cofactor insertion protein NarJ
MERDLDLAAIEATSEAARDFLLASLATAYPQTDLAETLAWPGMRDHPALGPMAAACTGGIEPLQRAYVELFDRGKGRVSLYETEHGRMRGLSKGHDLADLAGFYAAFGLALDTSDLHEMLDHLAVELEFYGVLLLKQAILSQEGDGEGAAIVLDARKKFLTDHLGRFVTAIADQPAVREDAAYGQLLAWCAALTANQCAMLAVTPAPLDFFPEHREPDDVECGKKVRLPVLD